MDKLAFTLPGGYSPTVPGGVPTGGTSMLATILRSSLVLLFIIAAVLAVIFIILGGIRWITSGGDTKAVEGARKQITYAIIGLVITLIAFTIVLVIGGIFRLTLIG